MNRFRPLVKHIKVRFGYPFVNQMVFVPRYHMSSSKPKPKSNQNIDMQSTSVELNQEDMEKLYIDSSHKALDALTQNDCYKSIEYAEKALETANMIWGKVNPESASVMNHLAVCYRMLNDSDKFMEIMDQLEQILSEVNSAYVSSKYNLIKSQYLLERSDQSAIEYLKKAVEFLEKSEITDYSHVAECYNQMSNYHLSVSNPDESIKWLEKALKEIPRDHLHPSYISLIYEGIAAAYIVKGDNHAACYQLQEAMKLLPEGDINTISTLKGLGSAHQGLGKLKEAEEYYFKALDITFKYFKPDDIFVGKIYNEIGTLMADQKRHEEALDYHHKSLAIMKKAYGDENLDVSNSYNNLAGVYLDMGHPEKAKEYLEKDLVLLKKLQGEFNRAISSTYSNLGNVYKMLGETDKALHFLKKAIENNTKLFGEDYHDTAFVLINVGHAYLIMAEYELALQALKKSELIFNKHHIEYHPSMLDLYGNMLEYYTSVKNKKGEHNILDKLIKISEHYKYSDSVFRYKLIKVKLYFDSGEYDDAVKLIKKYIKTSSEIEQILFQFELAKCYEKLEKFKEALKIFKEYEPQMKPLGSEEHQSLLNRIIELSKKLENSKDVEKYEKKLASFSKDK